MRIEIGMKNIYIGSKDGRICYIDGEFSGDLFYDDTNWTILTDNNKRVLEIYLTKKKEGNTWWDSIIKLEEPKIDTQKINPESSKLSDLDGDMKSSVEKMMFDMRQKQQGLPTSDELEKREKLQSFMKANPHLDFSKAKFS